MHHVSSAINEVIDKPYEQALKIVLEANRNLSSGFVNMVFPDFVEQYGIEHLKLSMQALKVYTFRIINIDYHLTRLLLLYFYDLYLQNVLMCFSNRS